MENSFQKPSEKKETKEKHIKLKFNKKIKIKKKPNCLSLW